MAINKCYPKTNGPANTCFYFNIINIDYFTKKNNAPAGFITKNGFFM